MQPSVTQLPLGPFIRSSVLSAPVFTPKGGLLERMLMPSSRSREKNCPTPARRAKRPVPKTSQAIPTRGAIMQLLLRAHERSSNNGGTILELLAHQVLAAP